MLKNGCPDWRYENAQNKSEIILSAVTDIVKRLRLGTLDVLTVLIDTRHVHWLIFQQLAPIGYPYYAGHYRGEDYKCLKYCSVMIANDRRVGRPPELVSVNVSILAGIIRQTIASLDHASQIPYTRLSQEEKLDFVIVGACNIFVQFLEIHPYLNGNGHTARLIIWAILIRYGYWPKKWPVEPRPLDPPYSEFIRLYRDGDTAPLETFVLRCIIGNI